jgi:hypothetical protein
VPYCYYSALYELYQKENQDISHKKADYLFKNVMTSGFPNDVQNVKLEVTCFDKNILRVKVSK